jgi:hypothetical protein
MAFTVETFTSEDALAAAIQGTVKTYSSEDELEAALEASSATERQVITKGAYFTLIEDPAAPGIVQILGKGGFFTLITDL